MRSLAGTGVLVRLALRRDRVMLPIWIYALAASVLSTAFVFRRLYPTPESREQLAGSVSRNGSLRALYGPLFDLVVRHTRAEEEAGRLELVGAGAVGRRAPLTAALITACGANLVLAALVFAGLIVLGEDGIGSLALGLALAAAGWMFAALAAVAAQLTDSARPATGIAGAALGFSYLLRAAGDAAGDNGASWLTWLSPIGWTEQIRAFAEERWWVFGLAAAVVIAFVGVAYGLAGGRDLGTGLLPSRPGPAEASPRLRNAAALAWRLQRGTLLGWTSGFLVAGAIFGGIAEGVADLVRGNSQLEVIVRRMGGERGIVDSFLASTMGLLGMVAAIYAVQATLRLRAEETGQRAEPVLATAVSRLRWAGSHLVFPAFGTVVLLTAAGLTGGLTHGLRTHDLGSQLPTLVKGALVQVPATWVLAGKRVMDVSPFTHIPRIPGASLSATPLVWLVGVAAAATAAGLVGFRQRDIG